MFYVNWAHKLTVTVITDGIRLADAFINLEYNFNMLLSLTYCTVIWNIIIEALWRFIDAACKSNSPDLREHAFGIDLAKVASLFYQENDLSH